MRRLGADAEWITPGLGTAVGVAVLSAIGYPSDSYRVHSAFALIMIPVNIYFAVYIVGGLSV